MSADETREALARTIAEVTDQWDEPLDEVRDIPQIVNALLASGLIPEGTTTEEWQTVSSPALRLDRRTLPLDGEQQARFTARCNRGSVVVRRTRTTYPDRVTAWEEVQ